MKDCAKILYEQDLKEAMCGQLDILVCRMCYLDRQYYMSSGGNKTFPRTMFKDGVTSLAKLPCSHVVGVLLTIVTVSLTDDGKALLEKAFTPKDADPAVGVKRLNDMRYVFSLLLCYWSWLKQEYFWKCGDRAAQKRAEWAVRKMLSELIKLWPREAGNAWFKPKVHEATHVPPDVGRNGSPRNSYSGGLEHTHLTAKEDAQRTQMNRGVLDAQLGERTAETYMINYAHDRVCVANDPIVNTAPPPAFKLGGSKGIATFARVPGRGLVSTFCWKSAKCDHPSPKEEALFAIRDSLRHEFAMSDDHTLMMHRRLFTEYSRHGVLFRAHPMYRSKQAWYDWVMIRYEKSDLDKARNKTYKEASHDDAVYSGDTQEIAANHHYAPGKILAFVDGGDGTISAVVMCCEFKHVRSGVFSTHWKMEYRDNRRTRPCIMLVDVNAIVRHCLMLPENKEAHGYHEIWEKDRWAKEFL